MLLHRSIVCAAIVVGAGLGAPAVAADGRALQLAQATTPAPAAAPARMRADDLVGKNVRNPTGDKIGDVEAVLIGSDGRTSALIVGVGGFLGIGQRDVAIPVNRFAFGDGDSIGLNASKDELKALPEYKYRDEKSRRTAFQDPNYRGADGVATRPGGPAPVVDGNRRPDDPGVSAAARDTRRGWNEAIGPSGEIRASKFIGTKVMNAANESIGDIDELLVGRNGNLQAVLSVGGFLGMGEHHVLVDWKQLAIEGKGNDVRVTSKMTKDQLKALPAYK